MARTHDHTPDGYPAAAALLRAVYDMIDAVKTWEADIGLDGSSLFQQTCSDLESAYQTRTARTHPESIFNRPGLKRIMQCGKKSTKVG